MIVVDASVLANALADDGAAGRQSRAALREAGELTAPDLIDVETVAALRRLWLARTLIEDRLLRAVADLRQLAFVRVPARTLMGRVLELRHNVTPYDASSVALAEALGCELVTADRRLAGASGIRCSIRLLS